MLWPELRARPRRRLGWRRGWSRSRRRCCGCGGCRGGGGGGLSRLVRHALLQVLVYCVWRRSPIPCLVPGVCVMRRAPRHVNRGQMVGCDRRPNCGAGGLGLRGPVGGAAGLRVCGGGASWLSLAQRLIGRLRMRPQVSENTGALGSYSGRLGFRQAEAVPMRARAGIVSLALGDRGRSDGAGARAGRRAGRGRRRRRDCAPRSWRRPPRAASTR